MRSVNVINNIGKDVNVTVNGDSDKIEIVIDLANRDFKLPKNLKAGDTFKDIDGDKWVFLYHEPESGSVFILKKSALKSMKFGSSNNYNGSDVDKYLCNDYLPEIERKFGKDNIVEHEVDLLSLDGEDDYGTIRRKVSIPTLDIYRLHKKAIKKYIDTWFWLATPNSTPSGCSSDDVRFVVSGGNVRYGWFDGCKAVRPFVVLKDNILQK